MKLALTAAVVAVALLAGCGGGENDRQQIEATVRGYYGAFSAGDGERACAELATHARNTFTEAAGASDCPEAIDKARDDEQVKRYLPDLGKVEIESVQVEDDTATVTVRGIGATTMIPLVKEEDDWRIEGVGEPASG
jgi:hypothetical protein